MTGVALIASSDAGMAAACSDIVSAEGLEPVVACDGEEAKRVLRDRGVPALLITELSLARADGFALLGELRRIAPPERCPALVVSAVPDFRATAWSLRDPLGIADVLPPDASPEEMERAIRAALKGHRREAPEAPGSPAEAVLSEQARLARITAMGIVDDRSPDEVLQRLVEDTANAFRVPIALVSLVLKDKQWFKAHFGLSGDVLARRETPRAISFCRHVVEGDRSRPLVVPDAAVHPYFATNPLVQQGLVRSYAGAPLVTPEGQVLGTLCIIDTKPLNIGPDEVDALVSLARRVAGELELLSPAGRLSRSLNAEDSLVLLEAISSTLDNGMLVTDSERKILLANQALADMFGISIEKLLKMTREDFILRNSLLCDVPADYLRKMRVLKTGPFSGNELFHMQRPRRRWVRWRAKPLKFSEGLGQLEIYTDTTAEIDRLRERQRISQAHTPTGD